MKFFLLSMLSACLVLPAIAGEFLSDQKNFPKVREAYTDKEEMLTKALKPLGLDLSTINVLIIAYKAEKELTVYVKGISDETYKKFITYDICKSSGVAGPKRKQGDKQVPEGFYSINIFNPTSDYFLSLGINYPNQSDSIISTAPDRGGDIYIHGACVTVGCLPLTDDKIKEVYVLAVQAHANGQENIPVYIFPFKFADDAIAKYAAQAAHDEHMTAFWNSLKQGSDLFETTMKELKVTVDGSGAYHFGE